jgi:recombinational DNA repair protein RecT
MPFSDEAAIVPFGTTATFIPMAGGFAQMFLRTGQIVSVNARLIHAGDDWEHEYGTCGRFCHKPRYVDEHGQPVTQGKPILA